MATKHRLRIPAAIAALLLINIIPLNAIRNSHAADGDLNSRLSQLRWQHGNKADREKQALALIGPNSSQEEKGRVYSTIAYIYSDHGHRDAAERTKSMSYCERALTYPLNIKSKADLYSFWVSDLMAESHDQESHADVGPIRRNALSVCISGLNSIAREQTATTIQELPGIARFDVDVPTTSARYQQIQNMRAEQQKARHDVEVQNSLVTHRNELVNACTGMYAGNPKDRIEFQHMINDGITNDPLKQQLLQELDKLTSLRSEKNLIQPDHLPGDSTQHAVGSKKAHHVVHSTDTPSGQ